jgi:hypothetical protein
MTGVTRYFAEQHMAQLLATRQVSGAKIRIFIEFA